MAVRGVRANAGVTVYKWWQGERDPHGGLLSGKPNVWARKVIPHPLGGFPACVPAGEMHTVAPGGSAAAQSGVGPRMELMARCRARARQRLSR